MRPELHSVAIFYIENQSNIIIMKKYLLILACACMAFAACDPEQKPGENGGLPGLEELPDVGGNENNEPTKELAPAEQQAKLESVGEKMLAEFPAEEFENLAAIAEAFDETYGNNENYDLSALEEWIEDAEGVIYYDEYEETPTEYGYNSISNSELLLIMTNHTGLFTFGANKVTVAPYDGVKAVFTVGGKTYEAEMTTSGDVGTAYFKYESYHEDNYSYEDYKSEYKYEGKAIITVGVPESINIAITENGTPLATVNVKFNANLTTGGLNLSTDALAVEFTAVINGFELKVSKTGYDGSAAKAQMMTTLSKDGNVLLTLTAAADLKLKTETVTYERQYGENHYVKNKGTELIVEKAENLKVAMDILGEIQVIGTCDDGKAAFENIEAMWDALDTYDYETQTEKPSDVDAANKYLEKVNEALDFGVYYDKGNNKQADIEFELYKEIYEGEWDSWENYYLNPVIIFTNGNKNKIEDFFTEKAFGGLIESFEELMESYYTTFGFWFEKEVDEEYYPDYNY